ncbi:MAG: glutathione S-transferase [Parasphingorhabdus sp.]|jgi:glutathione S-transferase
MADRRYRNIHFNIYGQDHSPWVQAVLLGLHERDISYTLTTVPPFSVLRKWGVMMPTASDGDTPWQLESTDILQQMGYGAVSKENLRAIYDAWRGVTHRAKSARRFFYTASLIRDPHLSCLRRMRNQFLRSFAVLYFYLLLKFVIRVGIQPDPKNFSEQFLYWEQMLEDGDVLYLGGGEPNILDMMLFGVIQCHSSIPVPPIDALQNDPRLVRMRSWIASMQKRFSDYDHLYSGVHFEPYSPSPAQATLLEQAAYWFGLAVMFVFFPITIPLIVFLAMRVPRDNLVIPS